MIILYLIGYILAWPVQFIFFKRRTYFEDRKSQGRRIKGKAIIISNHKKLMDFMMYMFVFPFRKLYCLMSELVYNKGKFINFLTTCMGGIKVDRSSFDFSFIGATVDKLNKNKIVAIFPEGKLPKDKKMQRFTTSYILIALRSGAPIIPVYTKGVYGLFKRSKMIIGKKIYLSDYCTNPNPTKEELEYLNTIVKDKILYLEKLLAQKELEDKYGRTFKISKLFCDMGRLFVYQFNLFFMIKVMNKGKHKKNLKVKGGCVIVANHQMFKDPLLLMCAFWRRRVHILAAEAVFDGHKFRSFLMKSVGIIRIDRRKNDLDAVNKCIDVLKGGGVVIIFPEGKIGKDKDPGDFKEGAAFMAQQANVPIITTYIEKKRKHLRYRIHIGEKIDVKSISTNKFSLKELDLISNKVYNSVIELENKVKES